MQSFGRDLYNLASFLSKLFARSMEERDEDLFFLLLHACMIYFPPRFSGRIIGWFLLF